MGCGASNDKSLPIVPEATHKPTAGAQPASSASELPPGLASFKNSPQVGTGSRRGSTATGDPLPPIGGTPKGSRAHHIHVTSPSALSLADAPAGSQEAGVNYCNPDFFPTHMVSRQCGQTRRSAASLQCFARQRMSRSGQESVIHHHACSLTFCLWAVIPPVSRSMF